MAYYTDGNGNYYCGQFSIQAGYAYNTSNLTNLQLGTLRTDLTTICGLTNYLYYGFFGTWSDGTIDNESAFLYKTVGDTPSGSRRSFTYTLYPYARHHGLDSPGDIYTAGGVPGTNYQTRTCYIVNQYGVITIQHKVDNFNIPSYFVIANTQLIDVNTAIPTNSGTAYYSAFYLNKLITLHQTSTETTGEHRVEQTNTTRKPILLTGDAVYGITCNDGQTAGPDLWMTKLHLFDSTLRSNGITSKCSRIGTVPNMAIGVGTSWIIGRVYTPATNLFPSSNNNWLCVGKWNGLSNRFLLVNVWSV